MAICNQCGASLEAEAEVFSIRFEKSTQILENAVICIDCWKNLSDDIALIEFRKK